MLLATRLRPVSRRVVLSALIASAALGAVALSTSPAEAGYSGRYRQYYSSWSYRPSTSYYYTRYYYSPNPRTYTYSYRYVIYYPSQPRYRYYYNPVTRCYTGRYEVDENGKAKGYSLLKPEDQKPALEDIPDSAFPTPGKMPVMPDAEDGERILEPPAAPDKDSPSGKAGAYEEKFPEGPIDDQPAA